MKETTMEYTLRRLKELKGQWPHISRQSGLDYFWIQRLVKGKTKNPGYYTVEKLAEFLKTYGQGKNGSG